MNLDGQSGLQSPALGSGTARVLWWLPMQSSLTHTAFDTA